jgi:hypothetical protein
MKCYSKLFLMTLLALAAAVFTGAFTNFACAEEQKPKAKAAPAAQAQEEETPYGEDEYNAYEAASKEPDLDKRGTMLLDFIQKYPKSALMPHIDSAYALLLKEASAAKKYELLETAAEKWLKIHPNDVVTIGYIYEAASNLKKYEKCVQCLEDIYKMQPSPTLAKDIFGGYQKINNLAKQLEWAEKLFKMSEFDSDFLLRSNFVSKYAESKNYPKAAEYAQLTLKSADLVKQPNAETQEALKKVRFACYLVIGTNLMETNKYDEAIPVIKKALLIQRSVEGYYMIAQCLDNLKEVEEAIIAYAKAQIVAEEKSDTATAGKAKARLEQLFKALHDGRTIGIDKPYKKGREELLLEK